MRKIKSVLVANRGEIAIRVFRACNEMGIKTVAIYSKEDTLSLHRNQADEAYLVGEGKKPVEAYLDIEDIIRIAKEHDIDAIHPGYGFLSENEEFARRCGEEGIIFIGPHVEHLNMFGDKVNARAQAKLADIPMIPGSDGALRDFEQLEEFANTHGFPLMIKAVNGGGGRGMREVHRKEDLRDAYDRAKSEAKAAFGDDDVYVEKLIVEPKHIEVQILGDEHGNVVHLHERDCSVQRRHQKVVEMAPAFALPLETRKAVCDAAVKIMKNVGYVNAGTVEFLVTADGSFYFIEVNPRIQVEHTVTEMITDIDIVHSQIRIAEGYDLHSPEVGIPAQDEVPCKGTAIQCRITTEDPKNNFMPDTGKILAYRSSGGFGIRLDSGNAFTGAVVTPYYDSLLVKATAFGPNNEETIRKMLRCLKEFRIRGVKTNIHFLINVLENPEFQSGNYTVNFIEDHPELFELKPDRDRGTKLLRYIADVTINGYSGAGPQVVPDFEPIQMPSDLDVSPAAGTKQKFDELGPEGFSKWLSDQKQVFFTDTTWRDAHQSLFATRLRTIDMARVAGHAAKGVPNLFSLECWGGATFDASLRFLKEDPWERLRKLRDGFKNTKLQMLFRGQNILGYNHYADDVVEYFVQKSIANGIDIIRIFDCFNDLRNLKSSVEAVKLVKKENPNAHAQIALCYTLGDAYTLDYWKETAKRIEDMGADSICIKDMAGLLLPYKATELVQALKDGSSLPIQMHTHYTSGVASMTYLKAVEAGADIIDTAMSPFSMGTSQPATEVMVETFKGTQYDTGLDQNLLAEIADYFQPMREEALKSGLMNTKVLGVNIKTLLYQVPGGMLSNLVSQLKEAGAEDKYRDVLEEIPRVRKDYGEPPLVTPSSQIVGTQAVLNVLQGERYKMITKESKKVLAGEFGQTIKPFNPEVQKKAIGDTKPITCRPADLIEPQLEKFKNDPIVQQYKQQDEDVLSYALFPQVATEFFKYREAQQTKVDPTKADTANKAYPV